MTTFRLLSDLHLEFHADGGRAFVESLDVQPGEVLLLAGDVATSGITAALGMFCERWDHVVFVNGNHEHYEADRWAVRDRIGLVIREHDNFDWLNKDIVEFDGARILGCPLWFPKSRANRDAMNDFRLIRDFG